MYNLNADEISMVYGGGDGGSSSSSSSSSSRNANSNYKNASMACYLASVTAVATTLAPGANVVLSGLAWANAINACLNNGN